MEDAYLKLFLTEELYLLPDDQKKIAEVSKTEADSPVVANTKSVIQSKDPLEESPASPPPQVPVKEEVIKYPVIVISETLNKEEKDLMNNILKAVNIKPSQIHHIVGQPQTSISYDKLIVFGEFEIEGVESEYYNVARTTQMSLRAKPLSIVNGSREEKTKLWNSLKTWFGL